MRLTQEQYKLIEDCFPKLRRSSRYSNLDVMNAYLYMITTGCKWRALPSEFGDWHTIYMRISRWSQSGVLEKVLTKLINMQIISYKAEPKPLEVKE